MKKYIIDVNLPYYFELWRSEEYVHQMDLNPKAEDAVIWDFAKKNHLTIVTKDSDFSNRILMSNPPPRVIHIKFGNIKMKEFHNVVSKNWQGILDLSKTNKLVNVYRDSLEGIE